MCMNLKEKSINKGFTSSGYAFDVTEICQTKTYAQNVTKLNCLIETLKHNHIYLLIKINTIN